MTEIMLKADCNQSINLNPKPFTTQSWLLMTLRKKAFENIVGKRRKCWQPQTKIIIWTRFNVSSTNAFNMD